MDSNDKPSTSQKLQSDSSDDDGERFENLSTEEIRHKLKTYHNLCLGNEVNVSNAFDIDMIGCFYSWLEKKKSSISDDDNDFTSFHEISDYLEASALVYSYRVDNLTEATSRLVEQLKSMNYKKSTTPMDDDKAPKIQKPKLNSEDEDVMGDIKSESRMDIVELKKEISDIIDEECVETDLNSEWSSKLSFFKVF